MFFFWNTVYNNHHFVVLIVAVQILPLEPTLFLAVPTICTMLTY